MAPRKMAHSGMANLGKLCCKEKADLLVGQLASGLQKEKERG